MFTLLSAAALLFAILPDSAHSLTSDWTLYRVTKAGVDDGGSGGVFANRIAGSPGVLADANGQRLDFNATSGLTGAQRSRNLSADSLFADDDNVYATVRDDVFSGVPDIYVSRKPNCGPGNGISGYGTLNFRPLYANLALVSRSRANEKLTPATCRWKCGWGPFNAASSSPSSSPSSSSSSSSSSALGSGNGASELYAIVAGVFGSTQTQHEIHLRRVRGECKQLLSAGNRGSEKNDVDILECSELIAVVKTGVKGKSKVTSWVGSSLAIVPGESKHFIFQLYTSEGRTNLASLVRVDEVTGGLRILHRVPVPRNIAKSKYKIKAIGSVAYERGTLCWTIADSLYCEDYAHAFLDTPTAAASPAPVSRISRQDVGEVCKGSLRQELKEILTGVAIHKNADRVLVYFGCYSEISGNGGMGVLSMAVLKVTSRPVVSGTSTRLFAGALLISRQVCLPATSTSAAATPTTTPTTRPATTPAKTLIRTSVPTLKITLSTASTTKGRSQQSEVTPTTSRGRPFYKSETSSAIITQTCRSPLLLIGALCVVRFVAVFR